MQIDVIKKEEMVFPREVIIITPSRHFTPPNGEVWWRDEV